MMHEPRLIYFTILVKPLRHLRPDTEYFNVTNLRNEICVKLSLLVIVIPLNIYIFISLAILGPLW